MSECPYCKEEIKEGALKCRHCGSALQEGGEEAEKEKVAYVVDRDIVRFVKIAGSILAVFLIVGTVLYGIDLKEAGKEIKAAAVETRKDRAEIEETKREIEQNKVEEMQAALSKIIKDGSAKVEELGAVSKNTLLALEKSLEILSSKIVSLESKLVGLPAFPESGTKKNAPTESGRVPPPSKPNGELAPSEPEKEQAPSEPVKKLPPPGLELQAPARAGLTQEEIDAIRIKEVPELVEGETAGPGRKWYDLHFTVDVETGKKAPDQEKVIGAIDRVVYKLSEKWLSTSSSRTRINKDEDFRMTVRVWGRTWVKAEIYVRGREKPIIREGLMVLNGTTYFRKG